MLLFASFAGRAHGVSQGMSVGYQRSLRATVVLSTSRFSVGDVLDVIYRENDGDSEDKRNDRTTLSRFHYPAYQSPAA